MNLVALILASLSLNVVSNHCYAAPIRIGLSMDTLKEERWQRDRDLIVAKAKALGAEVLVQAANGNDALQNSQAENLLTQGVDVLIVVPHNGVTAASIVASAHKAGKKVIAYDRLIQNADVDLYVSFDNLEIGRLQGEYIAKRVKGNVIWIGGAPTDPNAKMLRDGQMQALKPAIDRGDIKLVTEQWARDWQASEALKHTENALIANNNNIVAVLAPNDGTAAGVIAALKQQKLDGKVLVTGQDADLPACQRIGQGSQTMTIYKSIPALAQAVVEAAIALATNKEVKQANRKVPNGKKDVTAVLLSPTAVDKDNMRQTIVKDGFHKASDIYK